MKTEKPLLPTAYTIDQIENMVKTWDADAFAMAADARVRLFDKQQKLTFVEIGYWCLTVEQKESWRRIYGGDKFKSFGQWITDAAPSSRATCYAALGEVRKAIEDGLDLGEMNKLPRCNIKTVNKLSTSLKRDPEILKAAETMEERDFKRKIEKEHPDQHVEDDSPMRLKFSHSQRVKVDETIDWAMKVFGVTTREQALEFVLLEWREWRESTPVEEMPEEARAWVVR